MRDTSVKQIAERCQQGDQQAFGQLYTLTYDKLRKVSSPSAGTVT